MLLCLRARYKLPRCGHDALRRLHRGGIDALHLWRASGQRPVAPGHIGCLGGKIGPRRRCSPPTQCAAASRSSAWSRRPARPSQPWARSSTTRGQPSREEHAGCFQALLACKCCCVQRTRFRNIGLLQSRFDKPTVAQRPKPVPAERRLGSLSSISASGLIDSISLALLLRSSAFSSSVGESGSSLFLDAFPRVQAFPASELRMLAVWGAREPLAVVIATFLLSLSRSGEPQTSCEGLSSDLSFWSLLASQISEHRLRQIQRSSPL